MPNISQKEILQLASTEILSKIALEVERLTKRPDSEVSKVKLWKLTLQYKEINDQLAEAERNEKNGRG